MRKLIHAVKNLHVQGRNAGCSVSFTANAHTLSGLPFIDLIAANQTLCTSLLTAF